MISKYNFMYKQIDYLQGWDIEQSVDSDEDQKKQHTQVTNITKTQPSDRLCFKKLFLKSPQLSPIKVNPPKHQTTPLRESIKQKFSFVNQLINKKQEIEKVDDFENEQSYKAININGKMQQPINVAHLRIKLNAIPKQSQHTKAYTQNQLQAIMQLKRKNLYLKSVLKKVCHESDERYSNHQKANQQDIFLGYRYLDEDIHKLHSPSNSINIQSQKSRKNSDRRAIKEKNKIQINLFEMVKKEKGKANSLGEISRDYTINLHKGIHKETFKRKAPRAVSYIVDFGLKMS
ncbi:unnamed protein product [Paramecium sonneborni]|uniref:Uncharacterized protein n=1 Tax=Paramecium sonneborni TaxID=65129 RepID=A0A8S1NKG3_9CILI|nr:unnamed protein product [Paramecium sonneborni]